MLLILPPILLTVSSRIYLSIQHQSLVIHALEQKGLASIKTRPTSYYCFDPTYP